MKHTRNVLVLLFLCHGLAKAQWSYVSRSNPYGNIYSVYLSNFGVIQSNPNLYDTSCGDYSAMSGKPTPLTFEFDECGQRIWRYIEISYVQYYLQKVIKNNTQSATIPKEGNKDEALEDNDIKVFPNPTDAEVRVEQSNVEEGSVLELYDSSGKRLIQQTMLNKQTLSTSQLPSGAYLLFIKTGTKNKYWKIQKI